MDASQKTLELDGQTRAFDIAKTFGAITEEIRTGLPGHRVLTDIVVDNKAVDLLEELDLNDKTFGNIGRVVLRTRQVDEVFRDSLNSAPLICRVLQVDCEDLENFINVEKYKDATDRLQDMSSLLEWLIQLVVGAQSLGTQRVEDMTFSRGRVMDSCTRMQYQIVQLHFNLGSGNWPEFKKVLTGDFKAELNTWEVMFSELSTNWNPRPSTRAS